jgi:hypothetical protein
MHKLGDRPGTPGKMRGLLNDSRVAHLAELKKKFRRLSFMKNWADELLLVAPFTPGWSRTCFKAF